jgi:hypothetical protein
MYIYNNNLSDNLVSTPKEKYNLAILPDTIEKNYKQIMPTIFWSIKNKSTQSPQSNYETLRAYIAKSLEQINANNTNYLYTNRFKDFTDKLNLFNKYIDQYESQTGIIKKGSSYILSAPESEMNAVAKDLTKITLKINELIDTTEFSPEKTYTATGGTISSNKPTSSLIKGISNTYLIIGGIAVVGGILLMRK